MVDFSTAKELAAYLEEPKAMKVGAPGKTGYLKLGFELNREGKSILRELDRRVPLIVQQELYFDEEMPGMPCVYILSSGGPNVDGDRYEQNVTVRKDAYAFISTGAATKLAQMRYNYSGLKQSIRLEENAYLEYMPEPIIPCKHTRYITDTGIVIHPTATLFYSEIYMGGRKYYNRGELFEYDMLSVLTHAERDTGEKLFREKFIIQPSINSVRNIGVMHNYDLFANVLVLTPKIHADRIYEKSAVFIDKNSDVSVGITHLPNGCGLLLKVLGMEPAPVKKIIRDFCSTIRFEVKGKPLPEEFPWR